MELPRRAHPWLNQLSQPSCVFRELDLNDHIILQSDNHRLQNIRRSVRCLSDPQIPQVSCHLGGLADWQDACELVEDEAIGSPHCDNGWFVMIGRWQHGSAPTGPEPPAGDGRLVCEWRKPDEVIA
jgi:hypothetical protein